MNPLGRQPLTIVEIDVDFCTRVFGTSPCLAALSSSVPHKCFNTRKTCSFPTAFVSAPLTLRFGPNQAGLPFGTTVFPALVGVSESAPEINLSGFDPSSTALGKRARVTVQLRDFVYHDALTDKYADQRRSGAAQQSGVGYEPRDRATFFTKLFARWPHYLGRALRIKTGYVGDALAAMVTRHYVISEVSGPDASGAVSFTAKDALDLAENDKAQAPRPSQGVLAADLTATAPTLVLQPAGVGAEYDTAGVLMIGQEIARFTRSGDTITLVQRGIYKSSAGAHSTGDLVQQCLEYVNARPSAVAEDLLRSFAGVPASWVPSAEWLAANERWLAGIRFDALITKPTGVAKLIGEICQHGILIWPDLSAGQLRFKPNRPLDYDESYVPLSDEDRLLRDSVSVEDVVEDQVTQVQFWHGVIDPDGSESSKSNYLRLHVAPDLDAEGPDQYGQARIKEIYSRWLGQDGDNSIAATIAQRLLNRYRNPPKLVTGSVDIKSMPDMPLAGLVEITTSQMVVPIGLAAPQPMQIQYVEETDPGHRLTFKALTFTFDKRYGFLTEDTRPDYLSSTETQRRRGFYLCDISTGRLSNGDEGYRLF